MLVRMRSGYTLIPSTSQVKRSSMVSTARNESGSTTRSADEWEMSRSCQSDDVLEADARIGTDDACKARDPLGGDGVALVRHRRRALLAATERLLDLAHLRARQVADLGREAVERRGVQRERSEDVGVTIALEDLRGAGRGLEPQPLAGDALDLRVEGGVLADRARQLPDTHAVERTLETSPVTLECERPAGQLEPERRRLRMDAVRPPHAEREPMLLGASHDSSECSFELGEHQCARLADGQRQSGVEDVRGGEPVVEPAALVTEPGGDQVDERGHVVTGLTLAGAHLGGARDTSRGTHRGGGLRGHDSKGRPAIERSQLHVEPALELRLLRPDPGHLGSAVAGDHRRRL